MWALCPIALAFTGSLIAAIIVFGLGGLVWAPFTPVAYSFLQSGLASHEQQQVVTLWTTGSMVAAPLGLVIGGPLIELAGTTRGAGVVRRADAAACPDAALTVLSRSTYRPRFVKAVTTAQRRRQDHELDRPRSSWRRSVRCHSATRVARSPRHPNDFEIRCFRKLDIWRE